MARQEKSESGDSTGINSGHEDVMRYARIRFFDEAPDLTYMVSTDGMILNTNRKALETRGYEKDELVGKPVFMLYANGSVEKAKKVFVEWKETGKAQSELEAKKKNG